MHEISLVRNIFRTLEREFDSDRLQRLEGIGLKVGPLSNVEPLLLQNAFEAVVATDYPQFERVSLHVETVPVEIYCEACGATTRVENYRFVCSCGRPNNNIVRGAELLISGVTFEE